MYKGCCIALIALILTLGMPNLALALTSLYRLPKWTSGAGNAKHKYCLQVFNLDRGPDEPPSVYLDVFDSQIQWLGSNATPEPVFCLAQGGPDFVFALRQDSSLARISYTDKLQWNDAGKIDCDIGLAGFGYPLSALHEHGVWLIEYTSQLVLIRQGIAVVLPRPSASEIPQIVEDFKLQKYHGEQLVLHPIYFEHSLILPARTEAYGFSLSALNPSWTARRYDYSLISPEFDVDCGSGAYIGGGYACIADVTAKGIAESAAQLGAIAYLDLATLSLKLTYITADSWAFVPQPAGDALLVWFFPNQNSSLGPLDQVCLEIGAQGHVAQIIPTDSLYSYRREHHADPKQQPVP